MGNGEYLYDFTYVGNLVHANLLAASAHLGPDEQKILPVGGEVFQVSNDEPWLFWEFNRAIAKGVGYVIRKQDIRSNLGWVGMVLVFVSELIACVI